MSKKIPVANSPWGREYERPSDCARWIKQEHAALIDGILCFSEKFIQSVIRQATEADPTGFDDGTPRRWVTDGEAMQLRPIAEVGTGSRVSKVRDDLRRRQGRRDKGRSIPLSGEVRC